MPDVIPCRIVENSGEIHDGLVALNQRTTLLGHTVAAPAEFIDHLAGRFKFSHFTERGAAVYLEVE
jgi:hypothetical protein